ncbi:hypothetical protein DV515_00018829 [Chloebia gouldiae]|uniref:Uncharacterized protein n=1 Tax=Chloebia gouldiae TaxID=44316 RepID=A0A3L8Q6E1_CHLGU|nr:hypothetical protein DV515_00018829 [Chloebia gouldiae]
MSLMSPMSPVVSPQAVPPDRLSGRPPALQGGFRGGAAALQGALCPHGRGQRAAGTAGSTAGPGARGQRPVPGPG